VSRVNSGRIGFAWQSVNLNLMFFSRSTLPLLLACAAGIFLHSAALAKVPAEQSARDIVVGQRLPLAELQQLDGSASAPTLTLQRWRQAVFELQQGAQVELDWPQARALEQTASLEKHITTQWNRLSLGLLHSHYEREDQLGRRQSDEVFAFSPMQQTVYHGASMELVLSREAVYLNAVEPASEYWLDAGDGLGLRPLQMDQPLAVAYTSTGSKTLTLQARMADGSMRQSSSQLEVVQLATPDPDETWNIVASVPYDGVAGSGSAYVYLADGHLTVTNPVVIVEGFDIDNSLGWPELHDLLNRQNLLEDLRAAGFDAVVLDFTEAVDPIQRNGLVLVELLGMVNAATAVDQTAVIVGASMGGLVSRYALLWMEDQGIPHRVRKLISFDSPHKGANIPLGLQAWVEFFADQAEEANFLLQQLRSPASRQMLLYHLDSTVGSSANADPAMVQLNSEFTGLGGWPTQPRLVSVVNGSGLMTGQSFAPGDQLIEWHYNNFPNITGDVWAVPAVGSKKIFDGRISIFSTGSLTVSGTLPWDNAPGGSRPSMEQAADVPAPFGDIVALHGSHSFIPTISALALDSNDPFYDVAGDGALLDHTPFQTVYFPSDNQEHIDITAENKLWFVAEVQSQIIVSMITGDTTESGGTATFTVTAASAPAAPVSIALSSSHPGEGTVPLNVVLPAGSTSPQLVTVTGQDDAIKDGDVAYTIITAASVSADPAYNGIDPADVAVLNLDDEPQPELIFENGFEEP